MRAGRAGALAANMRRKRQANARAAARTAARSAAYVDNNPPADSENPAIQPSEENEERKLSTSF